ncbi:DUF1127 domain-containing protein [Aurantimonas sp. C2-6-R+9]|uniref:DUF1127 domain-containing protein n=1 Tax=unclassified Aurantimonas TaxID=2638230 RepID=UPI002E198B03|nr:MULTISPECIES: DUF1127 domain-containing protein [unclassified Aurantimonas]MEC5293211.1 DUF1127 domain-containing protein [Aurantimonas sp. C2-3-R2]MEC5383372.1 DUF1127 domain-containing protein [Aurantimonas sp. C2-6-R+9]MEC5414305.1 DUF1127 domain-containing protein [Aurantimonas sp. C2-4-R8]
MRAVNWFDRVILNPIMRRKAIADLSSLDDALLADIGLTRNEIARAVDGLVHRGGNSDARQVADFKPASVKPAQELRRAA